MKNEMGLEGEGPMIRVLIADEQVILAESLCWVLSQETDFSVVATVRNGNEALEASKELDPDIILMDIDTSSLSNTSVVAMLKDSRSNTKVVGLTSLADGDFIVELLKNGIDACLFKNVRTEELVHILRIVHKGNCIIGQGASKLLTQKLIENYAVGTKCKTKSK